MRLSHPSRLKRVLDLFRQVIGITPKAFDQLFFGRTRTPLPATCHQARYSRAAGKQFGSGWHDWCMTKYIDGRKCSNRTRTPFSEVSAMADVKDRLKNGIDNVADKAKNATDAVADTAQGAKQEGQGLVDRAGDFAGHAREKVQEWAGDARRGATRGREGREVDGRRLRRDLARGR